MWFKLNSLLLFLPHRSSRRFHLFSNLTVFFGDISIFIAVFGALSQHTLIDLLTEGVISNEIGVQAV